MNTLPMGQAASPGRDSGAGAGLGTSVASPAHPYVLGQIGFSQAIQDSMAVSIVRLEQENEELRAEVALLREEQAILAQFKVLAESLAKTQVELKQERDQWRVCAEKLNAAVCYLEPALLYDDPEGGFTNEREAVREFVQLKKTEEESRFAARASMTTEEMREDFLKEWRRDK